MHEALKSSSRLVCMAQKMSPAIANAIINDPFVNNGMSYLLSAVDNIELESSRN